MKHILIFLSTLLLVSCSKSDSDYISTVEAAINVPIENYQKVNYKDIGSIGYPVKVIDVTFSKDDFDEIIKAIDLKKYEQDNNDYYRDVTSGSVSYHIAIFSKENKIRYAQKD